MKPIILYSGGADSRLMLHRALRLHNREDITLLVVNYGQRMPEMKAAAMMAEKFGLHLITAVTTLPSNPLSGDGPVAGVESVSDAWVPGRNQVLLSIAASWAEHMFCDEIWIGANKDDGPLFPDCQRSYFDAAEIAMNMARPHERGPVKIVTPLLWVCKSDVIEALASHNIPPSEYVSGYPGTEVEGV